MAKLVIAGSSNCPFFARCELLADDLSKNLPNFKVHKIVKTPAEWNEWLITCCKQKGWKHAASPIIWRELVNRGGKAVLIGGANEFQEYVNAYYNLESEMDSTAMRNVAADNVRYKEELDTDTAYFASLSKPLRITVTCCNSQTVYHILPIICSGEVFGRDQEVHVTLFDVSAENIAAAKGLEMECFDLSTGVLRGINSTNNPQEAFGSADIVVVLDEILLVSNENLGSEELEQERVHYLKSNAALAANYAFWIDQFSQQGDIRVMFAGRGPVNFNTRIFSENSKKVKRQNIISVSKLLERQITSLLSTKIGINSANISDVLVWGDISGSYHVDLSCARIYQHQGAIVGSPTYSRSLLQILWDKKWLENEFKTLIDSKVQGNVTGSASHFSVSSARALADFLHDWWVSTADSELPILYSLGVVSDGLYDIPSGMVFSLPVILHPRGSWSVRQDWEVPADVQTQLKTCITEMQKDYERVYPPPKIENEEESDEQVDEAATHHSGFSGDNVLEVDNVPDNSGVIEDADDNTVVTESVNSPVPSRIELEANA